MSAVHLMEPRFRSEALHGVALSPGVSFEGSTPAATSFPQVRYFSHSLASLFNTRISQVCLSAASFNTTLWHSIASAVSTEARAMFAQGNAGVTFWAPNLNINRDPRWVSACAESWSQQHTILKHCCRWGRSQETPGESPYATSQYVIQFVSGMQEGSDPRYLKTSSCCKHFAGYDLEEWVRCCRHARSVEYCMLSS